MYHQKALIGVKGRIQSEVVEKGDFVANRPDFNRIEELSNYIKENNATALNEVNVVTSIDSVVGFFFNKCEKQEYLLSMVLVAQKCLKSMLDVDYPIYMYDSKCCVIEKIELTLELEREKISKLDTKHIFYWTDDYNEPVLENLENIKSKTL